MLLRDLHRAVDTADRQHADGAAGAVNELDVLRHQVLNAMTEDGVGVPAAKLHDVVGPVGAGLPRDRRGKRLCQIPAAKLIDIFHDTASSISSARTPASSMSWSVRAASSGLTLCSA